ncbi:putative O-unit flippase [Treponema primitia ZAS-2]|uniref:Putative O-unit flippase n=1 Tax=Treponema primitia (strain ATCC BAA-887 / DSM 12427 / ZAS-2) TaxID=545694 RepID=F5YNY1_TREPZ|nr:hypothetical protein [Treponema primitia]AEF86646.1 putative O-unit flippase [Treponema primitia ZAS-2]
MQQQHKDLLFTLINQLWRIVSGPITMILIPLFLSQEQQGYWYLFGSIAALSSLADLGFSNIVMQFSAHEYAFLHTGDDGLLSGEKIYLQRLGSFFHFSVKWVLTICIVAFPIIYIIGVSFFSKDKVLSTYLFPWTLYSIGSAVNFYNKSILSFFEGLNRIEIIQKIYFVVSVFNTAITAIVLFLSGNIYALSFGMLLSASVIFLFTIGSFKDIIKQIINLSKGYFFNWKDEVTPLFMKYAFSWIGGYFVFQIYTPLMHYFHGPIYSGKVGFTISLVMVIYNISFIWISTILPKINMLISSKSWKSLDILFRKRMLLLLGTYIILALSVIIFILLFKNNILISKIIVRFLPLRSIITLFICYFLQSFVGMLAVYLRGHKKEPLLIYSLVTGALVFILTLIIGKFMAPEYFFSGFMFSYIVAIPWILCIFINKRKEYRLL